MKRNQRGWKAKGSQHGKQHRSNDRTLVQAPHGLRAIVYTAASSVAPAGHITQSEAGASGGYTSTKRRSASERAHNWMRRSFTRLQKLIWRWKLALPFIETGISYTPPFLVTQYYSNTTLAAWVKSVRPDFAAQLELNVVVFLLIFSAWTPFSKWVLNRIRKSINNNPVIYTGIETRCGEILKELDGVVAEKGERFRASFLRFCRESKEQSAIIDAGKVFIGITQPHTQIESLSKGICRIFRKIVSHEDGVIVTVSVFFMQDGKVERDLCHVLGDTPLSANDDPGKTLSALNSRPSGAVSAWNHGDIQVYESTLFEIKSGRYCAVRDEDLLVDKSVICYPVSTHVSRKSGVVVCITVNKPYVFLLESAGEYKSVLDPFGSRIKLELCLMALRQLVGKEYGQ